MRKRLLGTIAAVAAGAGAAWGQSPVPPPVPIGPAGGYPGGVMTAQGYGEPAPPPLAMGAGPMGDPGMFPGGEMPGYPPPGMYGQQNWEAPFKGQSVNSRLAPKMWLTGEYLLWFAEAQPTTFPLVTTSAPGGGGVLGSPSTIIRHSNTDLGFDLFSGFRVTGGIFCDDCRRYGFYMSGFLTEQKSNIFNAQSDSRGTPLLARPFIDASTGNQSALLVSFPSFTSGRVTVIARNRTYGAEGGPIINLFRSNPEDSGPLMELNATAAFRFLQLRETLRMEQETVLLPGATAPFNGTIVGAPSRIGVSDEFDTQNRFYGGQVGLQGTVYNDRWSLGLSGKVAIGVMNQTLDVNGFSTLTSSAPATSSATVGGLFANATNIGRYRRDEFAVIPEFGANLGYQWLSWLSTGIGYNFLYASRVIRPGDQFSTTVNPGIVPTSPSFGVGGAIPVASPLLTQSEFWLQGISFSMAIKY